MKRRLLIWAGLLGISVFLFSAGSILVTPVTAFPEKEALIAIRQVGHQMLLYAKDSTSRVLPVKTTGDKIYRIEFISRFRFAPDTLVKVVRKSLSPLGLESTYIVNVIECQSSEVVYGFQIGLEQETTLVPCRGREQPEGCYAIEISFLPETASTDRSARPYFLILALASLSVVAFVGRAYVKGKDRGSVTPQTGLETMRIGQYEFIPARRTLTIHRKVTELSDKESALLNIFATGINQPIARQRLMKEVWNDDGLLVSRSLDVFVSRLRKKLKDDPSLQLVNIHGVGYKLAIGF